MIKFKFFIGGYFGTNVEVKLEKDDLMFYISEYPFNLRNESPSHIIPIKDNSDWLTFVQFLQTVDLKYRYENYGILDGTQWELSFSCRGTKIRSSGSNEYPPESKKFIRLFKAITRNHDIPFDIF